MQATLHSRHKGRFYSFLYILSSMLSTVRSTFGEGQTCCFRSRRCRTEEALAAKLFTASEVCKVLQSHNLIKEVSLKRIQIATMQMK